MRQVVKVLLVWLSLRLCTVIYGAPASMCGGGSPYPFCDYKLPVEERVKDLLSRLTLEEKVGQMVTDAPAIPRLGIESYQWWSECLHGVKANGATSFPAPIGLGASFNLSMVRSIGHTIATEARALVNAKLWPTFDQKPGGLTYFAPNLNIFRDPRWGRGQETPGEDPYLTGQYASTFVDALQTGEDPRYLKVIATCKHFAAYSLENWKGVDRFHFNAVVSDSDLVETYLPAFEACVRIGKAKSIMCSYNAVNGVPSCADNFLLEELARQQWNFNGYVVSDCGAVQSILDAHHYTNNTIDTCGVAIKAGTDLDCGDFYSSCSAAVNKTISMQNIDTAVGRLFSHRIQLGQFDPSDIQPYTKISIHQVNTSSARALALQAARESIVLLKNDDSILPLSKHASIALIGPNANATETLLSNYHAEPPFIISVLEGMVHKRIKVKYAQGCDINSTSTEGFAEALSIASEADASVLVLGLNGTIEEEGLDRYSIGLPGVQLQLVQAIAKLQKPVVVVFINGGPVASSWIAKNVKGIIEGFYPGEQGGRAIADVVFGDYNPAGRLPYTVYLEDYVSKIDLTNMNMTQYPGRTYKYYADTPIWSFGHGLSYTTFSYTFLHSDSSIASTTEAAALEGISFRIKVRLSLLSLTLS
ncbi:Beta-xylosidase/alpha-L-arabinofuranosidase 2, variant 3 [Balamuthia mandrillaris]